MHLLSIVNSSVRRFACLRKLNLRYAIIRCYESVGRVDPSCAGSAAAANAAGMDVHAYMFPCPRCGDPAGQVKTLLGLVVRDWSGTPHQPSTDCMMRIPVFGYMYMYSSTW